MNKYFFNVLVFFFICIFLSGCSSTQKHEVNRKKNEKVSTDSNPNAYFKIIGTEPFWNIEISEDKISYTQIEGHKIEFPYNEPIIDSFSESRIYKTVNGNGSILIKLTKEFCSDGMSDRNYDYKAEVEMVQFKKMTKLNGCGFFVFEDFLSGTWLLKQIKSKNIPTNENLIQPFIEFDIENNRISGNAGCNGFSSSFELHNDQIAFKEILLTRMFCQDLTLEQNFVHSLNEVNRFEVEGKELKFYKNDFLEMVFIKK